MFDRGGAKLTMRRRNSVVLGIAALIGLQIAAPTDSVAKDRSVSIETKAAGQFPGTLYSPETPGPHPGVLVLHTAAGLKETEHIHARNLAGAGFAALVVSYPIGWVASTNAGLAETVDWLRTQPESRDMPVGVIGFSLGASKAFLVAALRPKEVKAVVSYYGTYNVEISKFRKVAQQIRAKTNAAVPSPVQVAGNIGGAVLLLQGGNDDETPPDQTAQIKAALEKGRKVYELKIYPGAVHMFEREERFHPPGRRTSFGTITGYSATAAKDSWERTLDWLNRYLRPAAN
jgi:dienelactone hydrolase